MENITEREHQLSFMTLTYLRTCCGVSGGLLLTSFFHISTIIFWKSLKSPNLTVHLVGCLAVIDIGIQVSDFSLSVVSLRTAASLGPSTNTDSLLALHILHNILCIISSILLMALCIERTFWMLSTIATRGPYFPSSAAAIVFLIALFIALSNIPAWMPTYHSLHTVATSVGGCQQMVITGILDLVVMFGCFLGLLTTAIMLWKLNNALPIPRSVTIQSEIKVCVSVIAITSLNVLPVVFFVSSIWLWSHKSEWPVICLPVEILRKAFALTSAFRPVILLSRSKNFRLCLKSFVLGKPPNEVVFMGIKPSNKVDVNVGILSQKYSCPQPSDARCQRGSRCVDGEGAVNHIFFSTQACTDSCTTFVSDNKARISCQNGESGSQVELSIHSHGWPDEAFACIPVAGAETSGTANVHQRSQACPYCKRVIDVHINGNVGSSSLVNSKSMESMKETVQTLNIQMKAQRRHGMVKDKGGLLKLAQHRNIPTAVLDHPMNKKRMRAYSDSVLAHVYCPDTVVTSPLIPPSPKVFIQAKNESPSEHRAFRLPSVTVSLVEPFWLVEENGNCLNVNTNTDFECSSTDLSRRLSNISERTHSVHSTADEAIRKCNSTGSDDSEKQSSRSHSLPVIRVSDDADGRKYSVSTFSSSLGENSYSHVIATRTWDTPNLPGAIPTPPALTNSAYKFDFKHISNSPPLTPGFTKRSVPPSSYQQTTGAVVSCLCSKFASIKTVPNKEVSNDVLQTAGKRKLSVDVHEEKSGVYLGTMGF